MSEQIDIYSPPPVPDKLLNAHTYKDLRDGIKEHVRAQDAYHRQYLTRLSNTHNANAQGVGPPIASAPTITVTAFQHVVTGGATISHIKASPTFNGYVVLMADPNGPGFYIQNYNAATNPTGNIQIWQPTNYVLPGGFVNFSYHPKLQRWCTDSCRLQAGQGVGGQAGLLGPGSAGPGITITNTGMATNIISNSGVTGLEEGSGIQLEGTEAAGIFTGTVKVQNTLPHPFFMQRSGAL